MKRLRIIVYILLVLISVGIFWVWKMEKSHIISPVGTEKEKPLDQYSIDRLTTRKYASTQIVLDEPTATTSAYTVYRFHFQSDGKKVTGLAHIPNSTDTTKKFPVIVQFRGYVDQKQYKPGMGTERSAEIFARNGFISFAPDFLGYGGSDMPSTDVFEERFQTYTAALTLLVSLTTLPAIDPDRVCLWGHSNGGQIAFTVLTITQKPYPTSLWAPVSKPFPYSILYYTDEFDDRGKALRKNLAKFEADYNADLYSFTNYIDRIDAPIQIHQGTADEEVPLRWTDDMVAQLKKLKKDIQYYTYSGADHNMAGVWNAVVARDIEFFHSHIH